MQRMGFSHHPGPLPFVTVRRQDKGNRFVIGENVEIHGEHGCSMPPIAAKIVAIDPWQKSCPDNLLYVYRGRELVGIRLEKPDEPWVKIGETWHKSADVNWPRTSAPKR